VVVGRSEKGEEDDEMNDLEVSKRGMMCLRECVRVMERERKTEK
jgi:hypothetical protein